MTFKEQALACAKQAHAADCVTDEELAEHILKAMQETWDKAFDMAIEKVERRLGRSIQGNWDLKQSLSDSLGFMKKKKGPISEALKLTTEGGD